ncbi:MAG TPA: hypothetical protein VG819_12625 [Rhizomicrobium sp.]|jgi:hypothetical protein|nr:hypothetical protein [Rhizomicrobium sp.]
MKSFVKTAVVAAILGLSGLAVTATSASAYIVCNRDGECWHVNRKYTYKPEFGIVVHPNSWRWGVNERFRWREPPRHERGYWRGGVWIRF